jgi:tetratricopeptide (TPR) repeat protein/DNA-binding CsgD family transcriptional regulator
MYSLSIPFTAIVVTMSISTAIGQETNPASKLFRQLVGNTQSSTDSINALSQKPLGEPETLQQVRGEILLAIQHLQRNDLDSVPSLLFRALERAERVNPSSFEVGMVHNTLGSVFRRLNNHRRAALEFLKAVEVFRKLGDVEYTAQALTNVGAAHIAQSEYLKAMQFLLESQKLEKDGDVSNRQRADTMRELSILYSLMLKPRAALSHAFQALQICRQAKDTLRICELYNALGNIYYDMYKSDSALYWYQNTLTTARTTASYLPSVEHALASGSRVYVEQGKNGDAIRFLRIALASPYKILSEALHNRIADYYRGIGKYDSAVYFARKALAHAQRAHNKQGILEAYYTMQLSFKEKKRFDSAYHYMDLENIYDDSIYSEDNDEKFDNLRIELETLGKEQELVFLRQEAKLSIAEQKLLQVMTIAAGISSILLVVSVVLFYQNSQKKQRLKNVALEDELRKRSSDLRQQTLKIIYINNGLNEVENSLKRANQQSTNTDISHALKTIQIHRSLEKEWDNFNHYFGHLHLGFFEKLEQQNPTLTASDKRLAGLVRMNLSNREISSLLNIEENSVKMAKYRLKKKLGLTDTQSLFTFMQSLAPTAGPKEGERVEEL